MAMQLRYNAAGVPYLVGGSGVTVGPAPFPNPSVLNQAAQNRAGIARITPKLTAAAPPAAITASPNAAISAPLTTSDDPLGKFLEYDIYGGLKMKVALPIFVLAAIALRGRRR